MSVERISPPLFVPAEYANRVRERSFVKFILGLFSRIRLYCKYSFIRSIAKFRGAKIGKNTIISWRLARRANANLIIGNDSIVEAWDLDLRGQINIGDHVIVNRNVSIIRVSHYIDDDTLFKSRYYSSLDVESYSWLATGCKILPNVTKIAKGSVIGAYAVLVKNTSPMGVYSGNPAEKKREHNSLFSDLVTPSLMGGDLLYYIRARYFRLHS